MEGEGKTISISPEGKLEEKNFTPAPVAPVAPPPAPHVVRTFEGDLAAVMREKKGSVISIAMAEQRRRETEVEVKAAAPKKNIILLALAVIALGGGFAAVAYVYLDKLAKTPAEVSEVTFLSLIAAERQEEVAVDGFSQGKLIAAAATESKDTTIRLDTIKEVIFIETRGGVKTKIETERLFSILGTRIPSVLLRSLENDYMFGIHAFNGNVPFLILKTDFYENAFLGLLKWETDMGRDLLPFFGTRFTDENRYLIGQDFEDITVKNQDARALRFADGSVALLYAIPQKDTIVITVSEDTLAEIVTRLHAPVKETGAGGN